MKVRINYGCTACVICKSVCYVVFKVENVAKANECAVADNETCVKGVADTSVGAIVVE